MEVLKALRERRSIRLYLNTPIEDDKLRRVLEAARISPSAKNRQEWKFVVVKDEKTRQRLLPVVRERKFVVDAPVIIVACATESSFIMPCGQPAYTTDLSIAMSYMILEASELGLGTCWIGGFYEDQIKDILGIPENVRVVAMTPLGYPAEKPNTRPRKMLEEIVCYDRYK
ncbi:nitroreductase family protein [Clostridium cylindrosporum]|uniref:Putative NADH dehydrogenase/NAD(P)H nitroreductase n=1 Tax=Clostridium cylindrosporum DSM 605 TaxID=1121307 RepID=A0A0J8G3A9_CLOCY|nr:nitroreductase family protein [Clostridium cylindrosporum]KMT22196.1 putative NADH dehydrogenase/NAD(P)H nitroreductase [Clostridium cylindrosporum DSM 605]